MDDLVTRIERELVAAASRPARLRYARSRLPRPATMVVAVASLAVCLAAVAMGVSLAHRPTPRPSPAIGEQPVVGARDEQITERLIARSNALKDAADVPLGGKRLEPDATASAIREMSATIPLPPGGNFNGIEWFEQLTRGNIAFTLEYNAACQWARAHADGRMPAATARILPALAHWPSLRTSNSGPVWQARAQSMLAGGPAPHECVAGLGRERAYAREKGLTPTR